MNDTSENPEIPAGQLEAARSSLAAWLVANSADPNRTIDPAALAEYEYKALEEWLMFWPASFANRAYLVSGGTVYSFAPSRESDSTALEKARALAGGQS
ncbi:hypothetical protein [Kribbella sp. NPDC023855]|uniref:hypothetical protein n=1 Tax=Kribbella sp. NPDC023855 TaxID=3154698 RepID=UPI003400AE61